MKTVCGIALSALVVLVFAGVASAADDRATMTRPLVLLELFTSEGCSSCPPADRLLEELAGGKLVEGVDLVPLSLHVDYWNHLGWRDPYSSASYSRRQEGYSLLSGGDTYTPQLVVDGQAQLIGSDRQTALATIARAAKRPRAAVTLERRVDAQAPPQRVTWHVAIDASPLPRRPATTHLFVAVTEDGLASSVSRGENAGHRLRHVAVVRSLRAIGKVWPDQNGRVEQDVSFDLDPAWKPEQLHVVAWIAEGPNSPVLGVARAEL